MNGDETVRATDLTRTFGPRVAVSDLSLTLHAGEIVALLGPNGAGKTTTLRMLAGLIPPSRGEIQVQGRPLTMSTADDLRGHIGLLTESLITTPGISEATADRVIRASRNTPVANRSNTITTPMLHSTGTHEIARAVADVAVLVTLKFAATAIVTGSGTGNGRATRTEAASAINQIR